jgi:uncharacterized protein (DUF1501 family)
MGQMNRRQFLHGVGASALMLAAHKALATPGADPNARFLLIRVNGAMDSTLGLHPVLFNTAGFHPKDLYTGYQGADQPQTRIAGTSISLGPAAAPVAKFAQNMAIIRGINMGPTDLGHPSAMQYISAGRAIEAAPGFVSYLGSALKDGSGVVTNSLLQKGDLPKFRVLLTSELATILPLFLKSDADILSAYAKPPTGLKSYLQLLDNKTQVQKFLEIVEANGRLIDQEIYQAALAAGLTEDAAHSQAQMDGPPDDVVAVASLAAGLARVGQIDIDGEDGGKLDTHSDHVSLHLQSQRNRWKRVAGVLELLQKLDLFGDTLVAVVTEFNRTPGLNNSNGKEHNYPDNAMALFGRGLCGGHVIGDRQLFTTAQGFDHSTWIGKYLDFASGQSVVLKRGDKIPKGVDLIRPPDMWASIISSLNPELLPQLPLGARSLPGLFDKA